MTNNALDIGDENSKVDGIYNFDLIVSQYQERLYWHIRKIVISHDDTDDILQNTFIKVWRYLPNFKGNSKIYTWLYRIATNESITFLNKKKKEAENSVDDYQSILSNTLESDTFLDADKLQFELQKAILTLPEKQRIVFNMKYFDEMKYKDMSEILDTSVGALKASYHHAVKKIERYFNED